MQAGRTVHPPRRGHTSGRALTIIKAGGHASTPGSLPVTSVRTPTGPYHRGTARMGFRSLMGFLSNINDIGATNGAPAHQEQHEDDEDGKGQCKEVGLRVKLAVTISSVSTIMVRKICQMPQDSVIPPTRHQRRRSPEREGPIPCSVPFSTGVGGTQGQKGANFPGLLTEKQTGGIRGKNRAAQNGQNKDHHYLLSGVPSLWQNGEDSGRPHHAGVSCDKKNGKKVHPASRAYCRQFFRRRWR